MKETQTRHHLLMQSIRPLAVFNIYSHQGPFASVIAMTLISTSEDKEKLNYAPTWPSR